MHFILTNRFKRLFRPTRPIRGNVSVLFDTWTEFPGDGFSYGDSGAAFLYRKFKVHRFTNN